MIQYFKNIEQKIIAVDKADAGTWVNVLPPLKQEEFTAPLDTASQKADSMHEHSHDEHDGHEHPHKH